MLNYLRRALTWAHRDGSEEALAVGAGFLGIIALFAPAVYLPAEVTVGTALLNYGVIIGTYFSGVVASKIGMAYLFRGSTGNERFYARAAINTGSWAWHAYLVYHLVMFPIVAAIQGVGKLLGGAGSSMDRLTTRIMEGQPKKLPRSRED